MPDLVIAAWAPEVITAVLKPLVEHAPIVGAGRVKAANEADARAAYIEFQKAAGAALSALNSLSTIEPRVLGIVWSYAPIQRVMAEADRSVRRLMESWGTVHVLGNARVIDAADVVVEALSAAALCVPSGGTGRERARRLPLFQPAINESGVAYRAYIERVRAEMRVAHRRRRHWWTPWRRHDA